ncbi:MAG: PRC-barrel domain-containing protein [Acidimicrobiia bacterium]
MLILHEGTPIESADGDYLGEVDRLVIDPSGRQVSHVVVRKGIFFPSDKVIPVDVIDHADESSIRLRDSVDTDQLPPFEEAHYVELDDTTSREAGRADIRTYAWAYPLAPAPGFPHYPMYPAERQYEIERNIPDDSAVIEPGAHVVTADGEDIGTIREVRTDHNGALSHVVVDPGWLKDETLIPAHWISKVDHDKVQIGVGSETFRST